MSLWDQGDSIEDYDYLAAPGAESADDDEAGEDFGNDFGDWRPDQGFPDQFNAVRVWCTPEGELTKVRLSLSWREKVGEEGLARAFGICFLMMNNFYPAPDDPRLPTLQTERVTERPSAKALEQIRAERASVRAKLAALPPEPESRWEGEQARGSDFEDGVIVVLDIFGRPQAAFFDPEWLKTKPTSGQIARGVLAAYRQARRKYTPPKPVFSEHAQLHQQLNQANDRFLQMLGNGVLRR